ncbi:uncharacterized protein LOC123211601 [Mangifera indica]|uniref:uncharacterized protein LOC123211601 n=1 Tax=Mangifera indica TaxID=29780 RepID=UPI001CFBE5C3|nr:uncharacterized protein LOC123211601 [Mangifera indica]
MGQAFRRATGRNAVDRKPPVNPTEEVKISRTAAPFHGRNRPSKLLFTHFNANNVLEEREPRHDEMLGQMLGRVRTKPGGKLEMGESSVGERDNRPMPQLPNTTLDKERPVPPGTLNGKAEDHEGPMDANQIAEKCRLAVVQVKPILQFLAGPSENSSKRKTHQ